METKRQLVHALVSVLAISWSAFGWSANDGCVPAAYQALRPPTYPEDAIQAHAMGKAIVRVRVNVDGSATGIALESSAGFASLDAAAVAAVSQWRFQAGRCQGHAVPSDVLVPVDFQLSSEMAASAWAVVPDTEPMEFDSLTKELAYLEAKHEDVQKESLKAGYTLRETKGPKIWWVFDDPNSAWSVVAHNGNAVLRVRQVDTPTGREARYAYMCGGEPAWCKAKLDDYVSYIQEHPLPPPPKP